MSKKWEQQNPLQSCNASSKITKLFLDDLSLFFFMFAAFLLAVKLDFNGKTIKNPYYPMKKKMNALKWKRKTYRSIFR